MKCIQNFGLRPLENRPLRRPRYLYESCIVFFFGGYPASEFCADVSDAKESPERKNRTLRTRPKFEIKNLYGNHTVVFITKQTTLIRPNTTQGYLIHLVTFTCTLHVSVCTSAILRHVKTFPRQLKVHRIKEEF